MLEVKLCHFSKLFSSCDGSQSSRTCVEDAEGNIYALLMDRQGLLAWDGDTSKAPIACTLVDEFTMEKIANIINSSNTGSKATAHADHVEVEVPGIQSLPTGKTARIWTTERIHSVNQAWQFVISME